MSTEPQSEAGQKTYYKGYYLLTSRCNLDCSYCVLEDAPEQLKLELDLPGKQELIAHLYQRLDFRRLTLSGGEALLIGRKPPSEFLQLVDFLRRFRSPDPAQHLEIELYTNGTLLDERVADELVGVVDEVAVTIDSNEDATLTRLGRNTSVHRSYFERAVDVCVRLSRRGIRVKLHSVVGRLTSDRVGDQVAEVFRTLTERGAQISSWKFYQYMSYDDPSCDDVHRIGPSAFAEVKTRVASALAGTGVSLHFKDNAAMNSSLFNILPYGSAQYMRPGDSWSTSRRTRSLREFASMPALFAAHDIDEETLRHYHGVARFGGEAR
jgi:sulfatase maturation enzyme AslB (radical SAM superfamily)